jgi:peptide/nickel transport system substrate-binding protein
MQASRTIIFEVDELNTRIISKFVVGCLSLSLLIVACQPTAGQQFTPESISATDCTYGGQLKAIEAIDQYTVRFTLCSPDPAFVTKIANPVFSIQDDAHLSEYQGTSYLLSWSINGTGPYIVEDQSNPDRITFKVNPYYWGTPPKTSRILISWVDSPQQRLAQLNNRVADVIDNPAPADLDAITNNPELELHYRPPLNIYFIGFNNSIAPFTDQTVRQGFALAINRQYIVDNFFPIGSELADEFVPRTLTPGYTKNLRWYEFNVGDSRRSLEQASFDFTQIISLYYEDILTRYSPAPKQIAEYIRTQLAEVGISISIHPMSTAEYIKALNEGTLGFFLGSLHAEYPDVSSFYNQAFSVTSKQLGAVDANMAKEIDAANKSTDPNIRQQHYDIVNRLIKDQVPIIPVAYVNSAVANRVTVENVVVGSFAEDFSEMSNLSDLITFTQQSKPQSLWPADEEDIDTLRVATLLYDTLVDYSYLTNEITPALADYWSSNDDATVWTFTLRYGVQFSNGSFLDANDVVATFTSLWDAKSINHVGRNAQFTVFQRFFGQFLNAQ